MSTIGQKTPSGSREDEFPLGGGETGVLIRALDRSDTISTSE